MTDYNIDNKVIIRFGKDGDEQLTNFVAKIDKQMTFHDGNKTTTMLEISGELHDGRKLSPITIPASDFKGLGWVADKWGMEPIIFPAASGERDITTCIQLNSTPIKTDIYTHTGWAQVKEKDTFLSHSGGITAEGLDAGITVQLPPELGRYRLPAPTKGTPAEGRNVLAASLRVVNMGPKEVIWPLILGAYRVAIGDNDFAMHLAGRTGTFKSELVSLVQSHFGEGMDARHLPGSWSSTANANESLAYRAKDCTFVLDDFVPIGTSWQVRGLQKSADQLMRAQGNQAGRARLTDVSAMQTTYYPRGMILSTGEDIPEGHSMRGRMLISELSPGSIDKAKLSQSQLQRPLFSQSMANWIQWLASTDAREQHKRLAKDIRDQNLDIGHSRTPAMLGDLIATAQLLGRWIVQKDYYGPAIAEDIVRLATEAVLVCGRNQAQYLEASDPVTALIETIKQIMSASLAHVKTRNGGTPTNPEKWGWTSEQIQGQLPIYKSHGTRIGWLDSESGEFLLDPDSMTLIKKYSGGRLAVTPVTLLKRVKEAGILTRTDDARQRNTVRVTVEGHPRQVLAISLGEFLDD